MSKFSSFKKSQLLFESWRIYSEACGCPDKSISEFRDEGGLDLPRKEEEPPEDLEEKIKSFILDSLMPDEDVISDKRELKEYIIEVMPDKIDRFLEEELLTSDDLRSVAMFRYQADDEDSRADLAKLYEDIIEIAESMSEYSQNEDFSYWIEASKYYLGDYGWSLTDRLDSAITEQKEFSSVQMATILSKIQTMAQNNPELKNYVTKVLSSLEAGGDVSKLSEAGKKK
jgi:hypothetical protein